ncbi:MAG: RIP metalloprotease RseP, partial [Gammaproteobacteria bacterium]
MDITSILFNLAAFMVAIGVLVTVHEFGHFWVARKMGVKVLRFSVGFGKPLWVKKAGVDQTEYVIASIPLGGYVKMLDEREGEVAENELDRAFNRKNVWRRFAVVAAGPLFNFLFAIVTYYLIYLWGVAGIKPVIGVVTNPSPAYSAGIREMDTILSVNGTKTPSWEKARFTLLEESVHSEALILEVQGTDFQIRQKTIDISGMGILQEEQIDLIGDLGLSAWQPDIPPVIESVLPDGAAAAAGVLAGDQIVSLDGQSINNVSDWVETIRANPEKDLSLVVLRDQARVNLLLTP